MRARLEALFAVWIVEPFASVVDSPARLEMLGNSAAYAPDAVARRYERFEHHLVTLLKAELTGKRNGMTARATSLASGSSASRWSSASASSTTSKHIRACFRNGSRVQSSDVALM